ncbi:MAG: hypothetical protein ACYS3N_21600 [Planctomycetota bacterium]|jgi:hypothetical protein
MGGLSIGFLQSAAHKSIKITQLLLLPLAVCLAGTGKIRKRYI